MLVRKGLLIYTKTWLDIKIIILNKWIQKEHVLYIMN
jgi:hypothetical protein